MGKKRNQGQQSKQNKNKTSLSSQEEKRRERMEKRDYRKQRNKERYQDTNQYKSDFQTLLQQLAPLNLTVTDVKADGNCMYRAFSLQLFGNPEQHELVRNQICTYVESHEDDFAPFVEDDISWNEYCDTMRKDGEWGSHIQLQAASIVYKSNISIFQANEKRWDIINFTDKNVNQIKLSYHDHLHYASVMEMDNNGKTYTPPVNVSSRISSSVDLPSKQEQEIMDATGIQDLKLVKETMESLEHNIDDVYNYLFSLLENYGNPESIPIVEVKKEEGHSSEPQKKEPVKLRKADKKRMKKQQKALDRKNGIIEAKHDELIQSIKQSDEVEISPQMEVLSI